MARFLAGEMNMKEEIAFRKHAESDQKQLSELKKMEKSWTYFEENPSGKRWNPGKAWDQLHNRLDQDGLLADQIPPGDKRNMLPALRIAATIILILAVGIPALYFGLIRNSDHKSTHTSYADAEIHTVDLPDGSRVYLNAGAKITYPSSFNQGRDVKLTGEAFFEVMSDPVHPFTVRSGKVVISVIGTSFNVKQSKHSPEVEVYVTSGKVKMSVEETGQFITLEPGEMGHTQSENLNQKNQEDPNYISWKTKDFKFVDAELTEVLRELEESYHVSIHTDDVDLEDKKITTSYSEQSIDAILETIGTAFGLNVSHQNKVYYLTN